MKEKMILTLIILINVLTISFIILGISTNKSKENKIETKKEENKNITIKVGDYINGEQVKAIKDGKYYVNYSYAQKNYDEYYTLENVKSYLSEEDFKKIEHKVGE